MATVPLNEFTKYRDLLSRLSKKAADEFRDGIWKTGGRFNAAGLGNIPRNEVIDYAFELATKYGEASSAVVAEMYDAVALAQRAGVPAAIPAETATYQEVAKTVNGIIKKTGSEEVLAQGIGRLVKQAGTDTMLANAYRDRPKGKGSRKKHSGAQVAWVPGGDSCPYCLMLASNGWQYQTEWAESSHAEHVHANCNCTYMVRFNDNLDVEGYNPEAYKEVYMDAGDNQRDRINTLRREQYDREKDKINEQKREAYAERKEREDD